jgi:hypothetical protein
MRLSIFIILSSIYLNSATELHQLLKIPFLVTHYRDHQQEDPSLTLADFLRVHYLGQHPADNDDREDKQLPFKSDGNIVHLDVFTPVVKETLEKRAFPLAGIACMFHPEGMLTNRSFSIFRPPRLA